MIRWLAGNFIWPVTERLLGRDTMARYRRLKGSESLSPEGLRDLQVLKLRHLLANAAAHCPFYAQRFRAAGVDVGNPALRIDQLFRLPLLSRQDIRTNLLDMTWVHCPGGARPYSTGGSSGEPLKFFFDRRRQSADWATRWRARSWWGIRPGDREIMLWGAPIELKAQDRLRVWRDSLLNQRLVSAFDMTAASMNTYISLCRAYRPACLYGYPSSLALLARHAMSGGAASGSLGSPQLRAIFATGEVLAETDRQDIERAFGAPVVIEYGCRDGGLLGCGCRHHAVHVPEENIILEVLNADGRPVSLNEIGEVVVTHLENYATPMIRYRTGDLACLGARDCACGMRSMTLREVVGRKTDQIVCRTADGLRRMHALSLIYVLREADGLRQFRITQRSLDTLDIEIVPDANFSDDTERAVIHGLRERLGPAMDIRLTRQERITPTASGKHACVVSELPM